MRKPFSIKWIYFIDKTSFDQKYKFSNKNDMVCAWRNFKNIFPRPLFTIIFRPIIFCHIFNFHRADQSWICHILGVKWWALFSRDSRFAQTENPKSDCCLIQKLKRVLKRDKSLQFSKSIWKSPSFGIILQKAFSLQIVFYWIEYTMRS